MANDSNVDVTWTKVITLVVSIVGSIAVGLWIVASNAGRIEYALDRLDRTMIEMKTLITENRDFRLLADNKIAEHAKKLDNHEERLDNLERRN